LVERMRSHAPHLPIIVISGHGTIETAVRVIRLGAYDFLEKPFQLDALLQVVSRALGEGNVSVDRDGTGPSAVAAPARRLPQRTIARSVGGNGRRLHTAVPTGRR